MHHKQLGAGLPNGRDSPALVTAAGIDNGSVLTNSCLGTRTLPAKDNCTIIMKSAFKKVLRIIYQHDPIHPPKQWREVEVQEDEYSVLNKTSNQWCKCLYCHM
jgi:hypothetical protein